MTTATLQAGRARPRSLLGKAIATLKRNPKTRRRTEAIVKGIGDHVTTVVAFAAFDTGMFQVWHPAVWIVAAPLLIILEWKVRDD
jgi:hypothetical protein